MQEKKAQITLYFILGLVILGIAAFLLVRKPTISIEETFPVELQPAKEYVQWCMQQSLDSAVRTVAFYGGYASPSADSVAVPVPGSEPLVFHYYLQPAGVAVPSSAQVASAVAELVGSQFHQCVTNISSVKGYSIIVEGTPQINVLLKDEEVEAASTSAVTLLGEQSRFSLRQVRAAVALPLGRMRNIAAKITDIQQPNLGRWCVSCVADLTDEQTDIVPEFVAGDGETVILYRLVQRQSAVPLIFLFAHRLPSRELKTELRLPDIDSLTATVGQEFSYALPPWEGEVLYSDDSPLFNIDPFTGVIRFTPTEMDIGSYVTTLTMKASSGDFAQETFVLEVTE